MAVLFSESKTKQNLMRAFAGEGQARNRYTFAAEQAGKKENLQLQIFSCTQQIRSGHMREDTMNC